MSTFLQGTLHKQTCPDDISDQLGAIEGLDIDVHDDTCLNGMCRSSPFWPEVCKMAKALSYKLDEHGIKAGSLLHFSSDSSPAVAAAFLGVIIKKPLMQTFIEAKVDDSQASFAMDPKGRVRVFSAHEMFDTMLGLAAKQGLNPLLFEIKVEVWQCELFVYESRCLRVRVEDIAVVFSVSCNPPKKADAKKKQADPSLPFGLELEKRKGERGARRSTLPKASLQRRSSRPRSARSTLPLLKVHCPVALTFTLTLNRAKKILISVIPIPVALTLQSRIQMRKTSNLSNPYLRQCVLKSHQCLHLWQTLLQLKSPEKRCRICAGQVVQSNHQHSSAERWVLVLSMALHQVGDPNAMCATS